jgi:hypothetical protein
MKKQKVETPVVIMEDTSVKSTINMNVTQDDLVQVIVDEKLEKLENEINILSEKYDHFNPRSGDLKEDLPETFKKIKATAFYKLLEEHAKKHGVEMRISIQPAEIGTLNKYYSYRSSLLTNFDKAQDSKNPIKYFKEYGGGWRTFETFIIKTVNVCITVNANTDVNFAQSYFNVEVNAAEAKKYGQTFEKAAEEHAQTSELLFEKMTEYLNVKYNERKFKTKLIKASLGKSPEGKQVLDMIQAVGNMKMLQ